MKKIFCCLALAMLLACTSKKDDTITDPQPILEWSLVYYNPAATKVVAVFNNNILVRGSFPIDTDSVFAYTKIMEVVKARCPAMNFDNSTFIDISMLDNAPKAEWPQLQVELKAYNLADAAIPSKWPPYQTDYNAQLLGSKVCGHSGRFHWWPIEGFNPTMSWDQKVGQFFTKKGWNGQHGGYNFDGLVDRLDSLLRDESYPKIIYYHCTWGHDRTGALTFGWMVKHGGFTKADALLAVDSVATPNEHYSGMIDDYYKWLFP